MCSAQLRWRALHATQSGFAATPAALSPRLAIRIFLNMEAFGAVWGEGAVYSMTTSG
jgi:hypothetical protein